MNVPVSYNYSSDRLKEAMDLLDMHTPRLAQKLRAKWHEEDMRPSPADIYSYAAEAPSVSESEASQFERTISEMPPPYKVAPPEPTFWKRFWGKF